MSPFEKQLQTSASPRSSLGDQRLSEELVQQLEQVLRRIDQGESIDIAELKLQHPEIAADLDQCIANMTFLKNVGALLLDETTNASQEPKGRPFETIREVGDFRIIREIGRGGMGVVFEAEQVSLQRRVALKILPLAAVLDNRAVSRFKNEVLAVAQLDHPNIVDIYAVGCERGVHHYAMRLIDGQPLSEIVQELRRLRESDLWFPDSICSVASNRSDLPGSPEKSDRENQSPAQQVNIETQPQRSTRRSRDLHQSVSHFRSIAEFGATIAEALDFAHQHGIVHRDVKPSNLIVDSAGKAWITDFGLAQIETGTGMTMTGDLLGTARYMSPEQVQGNSAFLDHRTDIYSLGVTLYQLLTLELPFDSESREKLFHQILVEEPRKLRKINQAIPRELETIILKAMEKSTLDRYPTAGELASDLRRFISNEPIAAQRSHLGKRALKWAHRHPATMGAAVSILSVIFLALIVLSAVIANSLHQRTLQNKQLNELLTKNEKLSSETSLAIDNYVDTLIETDELPKDTKLVDLRKKLLKGTTTHYQRIVEELKANPRNTVELAKAYSRLGQVGGIGGLDPNGATIIESVNIIEELMAAGTADLELKKILASNYRTLAGIALYQYDWEKALNWSDKSLRLYESLYQEQLLDETELLMKKKVIFYTQEQALRRSGEPRQAASIAHQRLEILDQLIEKHPEAFMLKKDAAETYISLSEIAWVEHDSASVFKWLERAEPILTSLLEEDTGDLGDGLLHSLAKCRGTLGYALRTAGENRLAIGRMESAAQLMDRLLVQNPDNASYIRDRSINLINMGAAYSYAGGDAGQIKSIEVYSKSIEAWRKLLAIDPENPGHLEALAGASYNRAMSYDRLGQYDLTIGDLIDSLSCREKLASSRTEKTLQKIEIRIAATRSFLGRAYCQNRDLESAQIQVDLAQTMIAKLECDHADSHEFLMSKADLDELKGWIAFRKGDFLAAEQQLSSATNSIRKLLEKTNSQQAAKEMLARLQLWLGKVAVASNRRNHATRKFAEAEKIFRQLSASGRADRYTLQLGEVCYRQGKWDEAITALEGMSSPLPQRMAQQQMMLALSFWNSGMKQESLQVLANTLENIQQIERPTHEIEEWLSKTATIVEAQDDLDLLIRNIRANIKLAAGHVAFAREKYSEAEQHWTGAVSLLSKAHGPAPNDEQAAGNSAILATIHSRLGQLHAQLGRHDQSGRELEDAVDFQTRAVSILPGISKGRSKLMGFSVALAHHHLEHGRHNHVDEVIDSLLKLDPQNVFGVRSISVDVTVQVLITSAERLSEDEELRERANSLAHRASGLLQRELVVSNIDQHVQLHHLDSAIRIAEIWQVLDQPDEANKSVELAIHVLNAGQRDDMTAVLGRLISVLDSVNRRCLKTGRIQCAEHGLRQKISLQKQLFAFALAAHRQSDKSEANVPTTEFLANIRQDEARLVWLLSTSPNAPDDSLQEAATISKRLTEWDSENATMWLIRAAAGYRIAQYDDVINAAKEVGKLRPNYPNQELIETCMLMYRCLAEVRSGTETQVASAMDEIRRVDIDSLPPESDDFILANFQDVLNSLQREARMRAASQ